MEAVADRMLLGTDVLAPTEANCAALITLWRGVLSQLSPEAAFKIGRANAERLLRLREATTAAQARLCLDMGL